MTQALAAHLDQLINPDVSSLSTKDLILTRDETIHFREDLNFFYTARFTSVTELNDSNPGGMPLLNTPLKTEQATDAMRLVGQSIEEHLQDLTDRIEDLTEELLRRAEKNQQ